MGKGKSLTFEELTQIKCYKEFGLSNRAIAKKINRSSGLIDNFINQRDNYGKNWKSSRNSKLTKRQKSNILMYASRKKVTSAQIVADLDLPVQKRRVQQILKGSKQYRWHKRLRKPALTLHHKQERLLFARKYMSWNEKWKNVIFSDEKKFNLDGPDGFQYYWHDLRKEPEKCMSRNFGGGTVMVWAGFCYNGKTSLCFVTSRMNSENYIQLLDNVLIDFGANVLSDTYIFQQDNAPIHKSQKTLNWFNSRSIELIDWPARSPDLNPIENLWGMLARAVYGNGKQFSSVGDLRNTIKQEWDNIQECTLHKLILSMEDRIFQVIKHSGGQTKY